MTKENPTTYLQWKRGPFACYLIGNPDCPILKRWVLKIWPLKYRIHWFYPNTVDRDFHCHPWPFVTLVLYGGYRDESLNGPVDYLQSGSVRYRRALHAHKTFAGRKGALTFVISPFERRIWGFYPGGKWLSNEEYHKLYGHGMKCDD